MKVDVLVISVVDFVPDCFWLTLVIFETLIYNSFGFFGVKIFERILLYFQVQLIKSFPRMLTTTFKLKP